MTEHTNLEAKVALRLYFIEHLKKLLGCTTLRVLECYAREERAIYGRCYEKEDTISLDLKGGSNVLKIDNKKYISATSLDYDYFDLDAYGSPYELFLNILHRKQETKRPFVVILTDGLFQNLRMGRSSKLVEVAINNKACISIPALNRHQEFIQKLIVKSFIGRYNLDVVESKICRVSNQMYYIGLLLQKNS